MVYLYTPSAASARCLWLYSPLYKSTVSNYQVSVVLHTLCRRDTSWHSSCYIGYIQVAKLKLLPTVHVSTTGYAITCRKCNKGMHEFQGLIAICSCCLNNKRCVYFCCVLYNICHTGSGAPNGLFSQISEGKLS